MDADLRGRNAVADILTSLLAGLGVRVRAIMGHITFRTLLRLIIRGIDVGERIVIAGGADAEVV